MDLFEPESTATTPTRVVNVRDPKTRFDLYIGRAIPARDLPQSPWANPFKIKDESERPAAVAKYEAWLRNQPGLMLRLRELRGLTLGCWCHPKVCHGHVLARLADALPDGPRDRLEDNLRKRVSFRWVDKPGGRARGPEDWLWWFKLLKLLPAELESWGAMTDAQALRLLDELETVQKHADYVKATRR